jgi:tetratricopeptide (TPR) repeat protein
MKSLERWLALAPHSPLRSATDQWDVFLSYRSVSRRWVLALYDVLRQLDYQVFLDQYVLSADNRLGAALQQHLQQSGSGVLIWSARSEDSEWCQKELAAFEQMESSKANFRYVVAKVDASELPLFARQKLWIDFSEFREGPCGSNLLRLLCGLQGKPLPPDAVGMAAEVDETSATALAQIAAAKEIGDSEALITLAASDSMAWQTSPLLAGKVAEALIGMKRTKEALVIIEKLRLDFPKSIRPRQLQGLALARQGDWRRTQAILGELYFLGERDPETLGIYARTWRDRYAESKDPLHLRKARDLYAEAFKGAPRDYYTGINAASNSVLLGDLAGAKTYAEAVEKIVGSQAKAGDYWLTATAAELQLIKQNYDKAAELYEAAVAVAPEAKGDHDSTRGQARRLMEKLQPKESERMRIEKAFGG